MAQIGVTAVNRTRRLVLLASGEFAAMVDLYDADGDQTEDIDRAVVCLAQDGRGGWFQVDLREFSSPQSVQ